MDQFVGHGFHANNMDEFAGKLARRLQIIYKSEFSEGIVNRILAITNKHFPERPFWNEKDIVLITYGNSIQGRGEKPLRTLRRFVNDRLSGAISCIHILPFFPFTSDDGFAVSDFMDVNPSLGNWEDLLAFTTDIDLMADLVINHVSSEHLWFKNYLQNQSPGKDYFIEWQSEADYGLIVRPRNTPLFTSVETVNGPRNVWTTFSADQIDLNFSNPEVLLEMIRTMVFYITKGIRIIRLDAIAFLWKKTGTSSLHLPETHEIVKLLREIATFICPGTLILTETNVPKKENWSYFGENDEAHMVYQFSLPPLLLHALFSGDAKYLTNWADEIPAVGINQTFLNYTASHDGIGIKPLEGLLPAKEIDRLIESMVD
jgi:sucrose phosphorylase